MSNDLSAHLDSPKKDAVLTKEMKCELKEYEARYDSDGKRVVEEVVLSTDADIKDEGKFALRLYKYYTRRDQLERVNLEVRSPYIQEALRSVIQSYPDQNFTGNVTLAGSSEISALGCLFHYRGALREYAKNLDVASAVRHVSLLVEFVEKEFGRDIGRFEANILAPTPCIEFRDLWMLFKPSDLLSSGRAHAQCVTKIVNVTFNLGGIGCPPRWVVTAMAFAHNGSTFGYCHRQLDITAFDGIQEVSALPCFPLSFHPNQQALRKQLIHRGLKYSSLVGIQYRAYDGEAVTVDKLRTVAMSGRAQNVFPHERILHDGRIILDSKSFIEERSDEDLKMHQVVTTKQVKISEDDCLLYFITDVVFDEGAFDALLLPDKQKRLIRALTTQHTAPNQDGFDDLIRGKGRGCICLLHGVPGIGKTFTAESIADEIKRPFYVMISGDLGSDVQTVDKKLRKVLKLVTTWKAILLIDEADVFLEKRSSHDLARNSLVSIFLRTLEYFSGVMFFTTNRISTFDNAFQSRIHLALKYRPRHQGAELWKPFLQRTPDYNPDSWPSELLQELAAVDVNGRQIKNTVRTAYALAIAENQTFGMEQVRDVLDTVSEFQADFNKDSRDDETSNHATSAIDSSSLQDLGLPADREGM